MQREAANREGERNREKPPHRLGHMQRPNVRLHAPSTIDQRGRSLRDSCENRCLAEAGEHRREDECDDDSMPTAEQRAQPSLD